MPSAGGRGAPRTTSQSGPDVPPDARLTVFDLAKVMELQAANAELSEVDSEDRPKLPRLLTLLGSVPSHDRSGLVERSGPSTENVSLSIPAASLDGEDAASKERYVRMMQDKVRRKQSMRLRVDRKSLTERLRFEERTLSGALHLFNLVLVLVLMTVANSLYDNVQAKRSISHTLHHQLGLDRVMQASSKSEVWEALTAVEKGSAALFPSSTALYQSPSSTTLLLGPFETFEGPKPLASASSVKVDVQEFTLQAWVAVQPSFAGGGSIVRKRVESTAQELSCWRWWLGSKTEQTLSFNAHSFYRTSTDIIGEIAASTQLSEQPPAETVVSAPMNSSMIPGKLYLLTMSVSKTHVAFYQDQELVATLPLPYPVTDCHNPSGTMVGDIAMTIGQLRYYPMPLNVAQIHEVHTHGALLDSVASPAPPTEAAPNEAESITSSMQEMQRASEARMEASDSGQELNSVAQVAELLTFTPDGEQVTTPIAAFGKQTPHSLVSGTDAASPDTPFRTLLYDPIRFVPGEVTDAPYFYDREAFPTFNGTGVTMAMWYQHDMLAPYILFGAPDNVTSGKQCWGVWMFNDGAGIYSSDPYVWVNFRDALPLENQLVPGEWRHVAFQFDARDDVVRFFLDGTLMRAEQLDPGLVATLDGRCAGPSGRVTVATASPGWYFAGDFKMADLRVIVEDTPTPPEVIFAMANTAEVTPVARACLPYELLTDDPLWSDVFGHNCEWYAEKSLINSKICKTPGATERCRLACKVTPCFTGRSTMPPVRYLWDSVRRVQPKTEQGSLCINSDEDARSVREMCERGEVSEAYAATLQRLRQRFATPQIDLTDCDQMAAAIDETCTLNATTLRLFSEDVKANGGDYSILFWVRKSGESSLDASGQFLPHMNFYESVTPADFTLSLHASHKGLGADFPFFVTFSTCGDTEYKEVRTYNKGPLPQEDWTLVSMVRTNTTSPTKFSAGFDYVSYDEPGVGNGEFPYCMVNASNPIISALDFNFDMLVSPIVLVPWAMQLSDVQKYYYFHKGGMAARNGPLMSENERSSQVVEVEKVSYLPSVASVAPPVLFTTRADAAPSCNYDFSSKWLAASHEAAVSKHCHHATRSCDAQVEQDPSTFLTCGAGAPQSQGRFFGLPVSEFLGERGFADFLYSFTRHPFLSRDGVGRDTSSVIDSNTLSAKAVLVFYTPGAGVTTVLQVIANFVGERVMHANVKVDHFSILEGEDLEMCAALRIVALLFVAFLFMNALKSLLEMRSNYVHLGMHYHPESVLLMLADIVVAVVLTVFQVMSLKQKMDSASDTDKTVGTITSIPWADSSVPPEEKTQTFLDSVQDLLQLIDDADVSNEILNYALIYLIGRVLMATTCHPRLGLLTGTIARSLDDLWHATMLVATTMCFFASVGVSLFGKERDDFADFEKAMRSLFGMMMMSQLPFDWGSSAKLILYSVVYSVVIGIIVLNFILAIIVDSYMKVREFNMDCRIELEFITDLFFCVVGRILSYRHRWPSRVIVAAELEKCIKKNIGLDELRSTEQFGSVSQATSFLRYYSKFSALQPKAIESPDYLPMADEVERRLALMLGIAPSTRSSRRAYDTTTPKVKKHDGINNTLKKHTEMLEMLAKSQAMIAERMGMTDSAEDQTNK